MKDEDRAVDVLCLNLHPSTFIRFDYWVDGGAASSMARSYDTSLAQLVERSCRHWEARRRAAAATPELPPKNSPAFTITVERETGTLGAAMAQETGRLLGWHVYDHELLERIAQEMGLRTTLLESVDERQQSWLTESIQAFMSAPERTEWSAVSESACVRHLVETVLALGVHGECVIVGRGAGFILPRPTTLRILTVAPLDERIRTISEKSGLSQRDAARRIRKLDRERADFVRDHFLHELSDVHNYDLVLNRSRMLVSQCAEIIVESLHRLQAPATGGAPAAHQAGSPH
jgi:cytidylate kinase